MKIRPLQDRVIIKRLSKENKTESGIFLPDSASEKPDQGEIISVGPGKLNESGKLNSISLKIGEKVLFGKYAGQTIKIKNEEFLVMREDDIMAVIE